VFDWDGGEEIREGPGVAEFEGWEGIEEGDGFVVSVVHSIVSSKVRLRMSD
jgi:hypothetical protein